MSSHERLQKNYCLPGPNFGCSAKKLLILPGPNSGGFCKNGLTTDFWLPLLIGGILRGRWRVLPTFDEDPRCIVCRVRSWKRFR